MQAIPKRPHTMINYIAAMYQSKGNEPEFSFNRFQKLIDFTAARVKVALEEEAEVMDHDGGASSEAQVCPSSISLLSTMLTLEAGKEREEGG